MLQNPHPLVRLQRTRGIARVALGVRRGAVRVAALRQEGSAKAFLPSVQGAEPEVVFLNTAGGLTGGDRLEYGLELGDGACATATTQTAERGYRSDGGPATVSVTLKVGAGARLDWLPQETILFNGAALERRTEILLAPGAAVLFAESVVLGRAAMGERVERAQFRDARVVRRDGRAVLVEPLLLDGEMLRRSGTALLGGARALATVALIAPGAEDAARAVRRLEAEGVETAASGWNGKCVVRVRGADGWPVRQYLARLLSVLRGRPMPRVWQV